MFGQNVSTLGGEMMIGRAKVWMMVALVSFAFLTIGSGIALAFNGPWNYTAVVPKFGGNWYSQKRAASGSEQANYTSVVGADYDGDMWGAIVNSNNKAMTSKQPLYDDSWQHYVSGAANGQSIGFYITSEIWTPVNVQVIGRWSS